MPDWLSTMLSVIAGGAIAMIAGFVADKRLTQREREQRQEDRRDRREIRRDDFQRETLLGLQIAAQRLLRTTGSMHHQDVVAYRESGQWQRQLFPDELANENLAQMTETMLLASRVRDAETRRLADQLRDRVVAVGMCPDESEADERMLAAGEVQSLLIDRIGQLIRELDEAP